MKYKYTYYQNTQTLQNKLQPQYKIHTKIEDTHQLVCNVSRGCGMPQ